MKPNTVVLSVCVLSLLANAILLANLWRQSIVVSVPDGDSLQLADGRRIRLLSIDAPEKGRCMAESARQTLSFLTLGKHIRLKNTVTDDYGRQLAIVIVEDIPTWFSYLSHRIRHLPLNPDPLVNRALLTQGLATYTSSVPDTYKTTLKQAYDAAKAAKVGIWSETCRSTTHAPCSVKGNSRAGKKTYLTPECGNYEQTIVDEAFGDQWFCSETEALQNGFSKSKTCQ